MKPLSALNLFNCSSPLSLNTKHSCKLCFRVVHKIVFSKIVFFHSTLNMLMTLAKWIVFTCLSLQCVHEWWVYGPVQRQACGAQGFAWTFSSITLRFIFENISLNLECRSRTRLTVQQARGPSCPFLSSAEITGIHCQAWIFTCVLGNSGSHTFTV